ncbi:MAG: response regulator transcription factor [Saprospiraceae bacterium]|nr:response regulator transcription factor [Saprospiraceae bacterium]
MPKNILIVEDEPAIAQDIAFNLEDNGFAIAGIAHNSERALDLLYTKQVDLAILDINIAGTKTGIGLAKIINDKYKIPFIYLTSFSDPETVKEAVDTLPHGYLVKPFKDSDLAPVIFIALAKHEIDNGRLIPSLEDYNRIAASAITKTEYQIILSVFKGMTNQQIADNNFVSINTVKTHLNNIFTKLGIHNKIQLLRSVI